MYANYAYKRDNKFYNVAAAVFNLISSIVKMFPLEITSSLHTITVIAVVTAMCFSDCDRIEYRRCFKRTTCIMNVFVYILNRFE